jgi:hypothetical protein
LKEAHDGQKMLFDAKTNLFGMAFNSKPSAAPVRKPCFHIVYCGHAGNKGKLGSGATKGDGCSDFKLGLVLSALLLRK